MEKIDITVSVVTHDRADTLPTLLSHLEHQTFPAARFEILLVDDGSTDGSPEILDRYAQGASVRTRCVRQKRGGYAKGRNRALSEARGRWILFLDEDLLASPHLLERHVRAQEDHGRDACLLGSVAPHPQLEPGVLTRWFLREEQRAVSPGAAPHFLDWRVDNLFASRKLLIDAGGFDDSFALSQFDDAALAWRLSQGGVCAYFLSEARAYVWRAAPFELERHRQYARGYSLFRLAQMTESEEIYRRYSLLRSAFRNGVDSMVMPFYVRACRQGEEDIRLLGHVYRRVLRYELYCGFTDARKGRPPREAAQAI